MNKRKVNTTSLIKKALSTQAEMQTHPRIVNFVISTSDLDADFDSVNQDGWQLDNYKLNPVVLWNHDQDKLPLGRTISIGVIDNKLKATVEFATAEMNPMAEQVYRMVEGGFLSATSVGFRPVKFTESTDEARGGNTWKPGIDFEEQVLFEFSIVPCPANPMALIERDSVTDLAVTSAKEIATKAREARLRKLAVLEQLYK